MRKQLLVLALVVSCNRVTEPLAPLDTGAGYVPEAAWRTAGYAKAGFDAEGMETVRRDVTGRRYGTIDAVVIVRFGYLIHEQYVNHSPSRPHELQSVSKSITALLYGLAADRAGAAAHLDRPVVDLFGRYTPVANADARKQALTMRHLLSMRTGMDFWEHPYPDSPLDSLNRSTSDWVKFILDRRMTGEPGTTWAYNSGAAILTCAAVRELTGERVEDFARAELFQPIGITGETWFRSPFDGLPHCGGGLSLKPIDLARIGYLVLRRGRWGSRQVVPEAWIDEATRGYSTGPGLFFANYGTSYGYFWWLFPTARNGGDTGIIAASGAGGSSLYRLSISWLRLQRVVETA